MVFLPTAYIAAAALFWGSPAVPTPTWEFGDCGQSGSMFVYYPMCATPGKIIINREIWPMLSRDEKCVGIIHEYKHAALGLPHTENTIMSGTIPLSDTAWRFRPRICDRFGPTYPTRGRFSRAQRSGAREN